MTTRKFSNDRQSDCELSLDELGIVSGGDKAASGKGTSNSRKNYLTINLTNCYITSMSLSGASGGPVPE